MNFQSCAYCTHPNPVGSNYCNHCGAALHLKPCRHCGAVAVADARQCPACKREFPHRPTISVEIPWAATPQAPAYDPPVAGDGPPADAGPERAARPTARPTARPAARPMSRSPSQPPAATLGGDAGGLAASAEVLAETQRLIEKASSRRPPADHPELVFPGHGEDHRQERRGVDRAPEGDLDAGLQAGAEARADAGTETGAEDGPDRATRSRFSPMPVNDVFLTEEPAALQVIGVGEADETAAGGRWAPLVFLSLLGLVAAVALIYLVRYAGDNGSGPTREIASPHRLLLPAARPTALETAAEERPLEAPASAGTQAVVEAFQSLPAEEPGILPVPVPPTAAELTAVPAMTALPATPGRPVSATQAAQPPATPTPQAQRLPPAATLPAAPSATGECRPELRALNLCDKVNPTR